MAKGEIDNLTMKKYLALTRGNQASGVIKSKIRGNVNFKIKSQFMRELREDTFFENKNDDAHEHVKRVLDIISLFNIPGVTHDTIMLRVFPITLTGAVKRPLSSLKKSITSSRKVMKHYIRPGKDLGASVNVIPKSIFKHLKLANLKKTDMLVEMADMTKRTPIGIVENDLVKIDKLLFPSDFVVIDMLTIRNETMVLGIPFLATIHVEIDVFNKEISLGTEDYTVTFNMDKKTHNFMTHKKHKGGGLSFLDFLLVRLEENERQESGLDIEEYDPTEVHVENFEVKRYSFNSGHSFICVTKEIGDILPLGRENGSRFREMI
nr:hypothetical protein [Tanacetum cinerariifolium]